MSDERDKTIGTYMGGKSPVPGFYEFSKDEGLNFQLNRFYSVGTISYEELMQIGHEVQSFPDWIALFTRLAQEAEASGNFAKAAQCYRAAQFYTLSSDKDRQGAPLKKVLYEKCMACYDQVYGGVTGLHYVRIPYETGLSSGLLHGAD